MRVVFFQRLSESFKNLAPEITILLFAILSVQPHNFLGNSVISPFLCLSAVYYWSLYRPGHLSVLGLIIIGIVTDLLVGVNIGFTPMLFLIVFSISSRWQKELLSKPFHIIWGGFALISAIAFFIAWAIISIFAFQYAEHEPFVIQYFMTLISFPILGWVLSHIQRVLSG